MARFKLAEVERPDNDPFEVEGSDGTVYTLPHPMSLHYDDIMQVDVANAAKSLEILLGDQYDKFASDPDLDGFALQALFEQWQDHYGVAAGEAGASSRSSSGTARRSKQTSRRGTTTR